jgi:hypothetical protein
MSQEALQQPKQDHYADEIDLKDIIQPLWRAKFMIILFGLLFASAVLVYQIGGFTFDKSDKALMQVHFNFKGADQGKYPNESLFSPQEILSSPVLSQVYQNLDKPKFSYDEFAAAITLTPNISGVEELEQLINTLVAKDKGLSVTEFNSNIQQYTATLLSQSKTNVTISMDLTLVNGNLDNATQILTSLPQVWAQQALQDRGVLSVHMRPISTIGLNSEQDELLVSINILSDSHQVLADHIKQLLSDKDTSSIVDPSTGRSVSDLQHLINMEGKYKVAILKELIIKAGVGVNDQAWYRGFREARLGKLNREKDSLERMVEVYDNAIIQFNQQQAQQTQSVSSNSNAGGTQVYSPQYSDDLINSLLQLGSKMADPEYRKQLLQKKIDLSSKLQLVITEIEFYHSGSDQQLESGVDITQIGVLLSKSSATLVQMSESLKHITNIANQRYLDNNGQLYDVLGSIIKKSSGNLSNKLVLKLILAFIMGCVIATISIFIRRVLADKVED